MRSSPGTQAHDLLATMESVLDPGTPRNVFNDLLRADRASIPDSMWVPKIALMFADAPWLVEAFLMVVGWIGPDPLMMSHVAPSSPPMPVPLGSIDASVPTAVFHARMPSPNYHAALMGSGPRAVSPPGTAKGWFIDHPRSPMHALSHPTSSASPSSSVSDQEQLQQTSQTPPLPVFHVSPAAAGGRLTDDGFANFHIPTILHSPVASPRESPSQSPDLSATAPSPLGLGVHTEAGDITETEQQRVPVETLGRITAASRPSASTTPNAQGQQEQQEVDDQDDDPLGWIDETSSSSSSSAAAPQPVSSTTAATFARAPLHLPPCGKLPSGNPAMLPLPQRVHQQQQMHHAAAHHHIHHAHSHGAHTSHAHGHGHGHAHVHVHGHGHRDHHGGFLHPSIAFGIHHGARHAMPGPQREDVHPRSSPRLISEAEVNAAVSDDKDDQQEHIRAARDRGHDSYALQKALSERRLGMDI
ncbi:hypothetical protein BCR44DRAFT_1441658 [Catenaria anguillulae PL171]|uniref:Uncharacterized protein n=1 Tax=Catenaria anguillulae PL171 TaxID=765915 RepID=A0A1Y2HB55_9FUNG|nr:hypothetical protein BCR44DRAFT_1441658 [Catenaria anguillulae PL171]